MSRLSRTVWLLVLIVCGFISDVKAQKSSLSPKDFTFVQKGQPLATLLVADNPDDAHLEAAREVNYWVHRITGTKLNIVEYRMWNGEFPVISIGFTPLAVEHGITERSLSEELGPQSARIIVRPDMIILASCGQPEHAALELVKHGFGARWICPGEIGEVFTPRTTLSVPVGARTWRTRLPDMRRIRGTFFTINNKNRTRLVNAFGEQFAQECWENVWPEISNQTMHWLWRQRVNTNRVSIGHAFTRWWDAYSDDHPDWFAKHPEGRNRLSPKLIKLCVSNPQVARQVVANWAANDRPAGRDLRVMPNDVRGFCVCANCRAWDAPQMQALSDAQIYASDLAVITDRYVRFWNNVAELAVKIDPSVRLTTYAYRSYRVPPLTDIKVHPSILVGLVAGEGYYPDEPVREDWTGWAKAGASLFWRPNLMHAGHGMPYIYASSLGEDLKYFHENRMVGVDFDALIGNWATQGLNYYVAAEIITRPEADVEEVIQEYYNAFGAAAGAIQDYFEYWNKVTLNGPELLREHKLVSSETWGGWNPAFVQLAPLLYTENVMQMAESHLSRAEQLANADSEVVRKRVELLRSGLEHTRLTVAAIADTIAAKKAPSEQTVKRAQMSQARLREYRIGLFSTHPLAVNSVYLVNMERRRDFMWGGMNP